MIAGAILELTGILFLLLCSAFFSSAETALFSLSTLQVHRLRRSRPDAAALLEGLLATPTRLLSTILIGNTLVNVSAAGLGYLLAEEFWPGRGEWISIPAMTLALLLFGEITPKRLAMLHAETLSVRYGPLLKWLIEVTAPLRAMLEAISRYLLSKGAKLVVVACNTASAAALHHLRRTFPEIPFVGMEPAVKPAAEYTRSGVVGVLATPATFQGELYASVVERFANGVTVLQQTCPGLVSQIEAGQITGIETREILERALNPMLEQGIDTVVLGCTHYPFVIPLIEDIVGPSVRVIDPAPAVARQMRRVLLERNLLNQSASPKTVEFLTSGDPNRLESLLPGLLEEQGSVRQVCWQMDELTECDNY